MFKIVPRQKTIEIFLQKCFPPSLINILGMLNLLIIGK